MAAPIVFSPVFWSVLRYGSVAAVALYTANGRRSQPKDRLQEQVLDDLPEGVRAHAHRAEAERAMHGHSRFRQTIRWRRSGPGLEIDLAALGRMRLRRVD